MKKILKIVGIVLVSIVSILYLSFLFVIPKVVDLNQFKPLVQQLAKEQAKLYIDFDNIKVDTTPWLEAGVNVAGLKIKFLDGVDLFSTEKIQARISLPALLGLSVRVSTADVYSPKINLDIVDGEQYKIVGLVEDLFNEQAKNSDFSKINTTSKAKQSFDPSIIKIVVPDFTIYDYKVLINDTKNKQNMSIQGDKVVLGYFNGKKIRVKASSSLLVDEKNKINANVLIDTFIPKAQPALDEEDDPTQRLDVPFVNPIDMYKMYDFKSNINAKIKVRERNNNILLYGFANLEDISLTLSNYKLPSSYMKYKFNGNKVFLDTDLYVAEKQHIQAVGKIKYGKKPFVDFALKTTKIYLNDLIVLTKAVLDTFNLPNNLDKITGYGYFEADTKIKTNFKRQKSEGYVRAKDVKLLHSMAGLLIKEANLDISLADNMLDIKQAVANVNGAKIKAQGSINKKAVVDIQVYTNNLSIKELYSAFAPSVLRKQFALDSAFVSLNLKIQGKLKNAVTFLNLRLKDLYLRETKNAFSLTNEELDFRIDTKLPSLDGSLINKNFRFNIPSTNSSIYFPFVVVNMNEKDIAIIRSGFRINKKSIINFNGNILNYIKNPYVYFNVDGSFLSDDLKILIGEAASFYVDAKGSLPLRVNIEGTLNKMSIIAQLMSDANNYFTPITFENIKGKQNIFQFRADYKGNRIKIKDTGLYSKNVPTEFNGLLENNMLNSIPIVSLSSTITKLNTEPYINLLKITIPKVLNGTIYALDNSTFKVDKTMIFAFGEAVAPRLRGVFRVFDINIPTLFTTIKEAYIDLQTRSMPFFANEVLINGSDFRIDGNVNLNALPIFTVTKLNVNSNKIDVNGLLKVSEEATKLVPSQKNVVEKTTTPAGLPLVVETGNIDFKNIDMAPLIVTNTTGHIWLKNNVFYLDRLRTHALKGTLTGEVAMNLLNSILAVNVHGEDFDVEESLLVLANMKDSLSGIADFDADIKMNAAAKTQAEQMKSINGSVDFEVKEGQLGPFGRIENLILAENIRNSKFFETAIGSVINSIATIETSHFDVMNGHLILTDGIVDINPITTQGNVLCVHIDGNMNLISNDADMKLRARMGSQVANMLGPLAAINPVNLVRATPGLNIMAAKAFQFFCETVTQTELDALPDFSQEFSSLSTTKFQVVLNGNLSKPLSMIKSFKWLALESEIAAAEEFINALPDVSLLENPETATYEELMAAKAKEDARIINRLRRLFSNEN